MFDKPTIAERKLSDTLVILDSVDQLANFVCGVFGGGGEHMAVNVEGSLVKSQFIRREI